MPLTKEPEKIPFQSDNKNDVYLISHKPLSENSTESYSNRAKSKKIEKEDVGLFDIKANGYMCWALKSLAFPPFSIFATAFCIGRRLNEKHRFWKYLLPGILLTGAFIYSIWSIVLMFEPESKPESPVPPGSDFYLKLIEFLPIGIKVLFAFFCFQILFLQRRKFVELTKKDEHVCITCLTSKFCFPCSFAQMALQTQHDTYTV